MGRLQFPVIVLAQNGSFVARVIGAPEIEARGSSPPEALQCLKQDLQQRHRRGELHVIDVEFEGLAGLAGTYADDPTLGEIVEEAYRQRDAQRDAEFPE